ncbi:hypothetical protein [uncultured Endozoicomonas sp.]|uniref:hypothetical protein n=1 Tax=uncultured Endozoicomonas sp. TaxID=432652 RepID=UPI00262A04CA|nr:hypothetical protein [uncultured Endozoicomonas sp.]
MIPPIGPSNTNKARAPENQELEQKPASNPEKLNRTSIKNSKGRSKLKKLGGLLSSAGKNIKQRTVKQADTKVSTKSLRSFSHLKSLINRAMSFKLSPPKDNDTDTLKKHYGNVLITLNVAQELYDQVSALTREEMKNLDTMNSQGTIGLVELKADAYDLLLQRKVEAKTAKKAYISQQRSDNSQEAAFTKAGSFFQLTKKLLSTTLSPANHSSKELKVHLANLQSLRNQAQSAMAKGKHLMNKIRDGRFKYHFSVGNLNLDLKKELLILKQKSEQLRKEIEQTKEQIKNVKVLNKLGKSKVAENLPNLNTAEVVSESPAQTEEPIPATVITRQISQEEKSVLLSLDDCNTESINNPNFTEKQLNTVSEWVIQALYDNTTDKTALVELFNTFLNTIDSPSLDENNNPAYYKSNTLVSAFSRALDVLQYEGSAAEAHVCFDMHLNRQSIT